MNLRFRAIGWLLAGVVLAGGCRPEGATSTSPGGGRAGSLDPYYTYYTGPVQVGRSYDYQTRERVTSTEVGGDYDPAVSPDGKWLIYASTYHSQTPEIYMKSVSGATITRLTNTDWAEIQPCFSPDGQSFAYATNKRGNWDIYVQPVGGGELTPLTSGMKTDEISPCFHPGGKWIAFSRYAERIGCWEIVVKNRETQQERIIGEGLYPRFSPDGRKIAFQRARTRSPRWYSIWTVDIDPDVNGISSPTEVVSSSKWAAINPCWSPDGKYIAFATVHESRIAQVTRRILMGDDIWVVNIQGQDLVKLTDTEAPDSHPFWARDAKGKDRIFFCSMIEGPKNIWAVTPRLPWPYSSVRGPLPGPGPINPAPPVESKEEPDKPGGLQTYMPPPPPAVVSGPDAGGK